MRRRPPNNNNTLGYKLGPIGYIQNMSDNNLQFPWLDVLNNHSKLDLLQS